MQILNAIQVIVYQKNRYAMQSELALIKINVSTHCL
jgi:hypothetical protein